MYDIERYIEAVSVEDAIQHLKADPDASVISGGTDVLVRLRSGKGVGGTLVSIHEIPELHGVDRLLDGTLVIGPATCFSDLAKDPLIRSCVPYLGEAVETVGGPQIRNMGTIGGNLCNGATSADSAAVMQTLNARLVLQGPDGSREVPVTEFYLGPGKTVRRRDEILTAILIEAKDYLGFTGCYIKYGKRKAMEIATLGCCVRVKLGPAPEDSGEGPGTENGGGQDPAALQTQNAAGPGSRIIRDIRIGYGVAAPTPIRCYKTENLLRGRSASDPSIYELIGEHVLEEVQPRSSWRASKEFRLQLIAELARRALREAMLSSLGNSLLDQTSAG